jgi:hypothetical protein
MVWTIPYPELRLIEIISPDVAHNISVPIAFGAEIFYVMWV